MKNKNIKVLLLIIAAVLLTLNLFQFNNNVSHNRLMDRLDLCQESGQSRNRHSSQLLSKTNWRKIPQR
ncbi:hypothetical protein, partial [Paenibacillus odorifer]|uniref:hypothetical protein n=1 Tax=Paenibacillus odorifer TaxID=189426 RepID=UPI001C4D64F9